jgi:hypothetical protein
MWRLFKTDAAKEWVEAGSFDSVRAAVRGIIEIEGSDKIGIHLETFVDTMDSTDEVALGHFEYSGRKSLYVVKRIVQ